MAITPINFPAAPQVVFDPAAAHRDGLSLRKLMTEVEHQPELIAQQLASARAAQAATEAQTAGVLQKNEQDKRELSSKKWLAERANFYAKQGKPVDYAQVGVDASMNPDIDPQTVFTYLDKAATTGSNQTKQKSERIALANSIVKASDNMIGIQKNPTVAVNMLANAHKVLSKTLGDPEEVKMFISQYWNLPGEVPLNPDGSTDTAAMGSYLIQQSKLNQEASRTAEERVQEDLSRTRIEQTDETIAQSGKGTGTGAEERADTSSVNAKALREQILAARPDLAGTIDNMSVADMKQRYGALVAEDVVPGSLKAKATQERVEYLNNADVMTRLANAARASGLDNKKGLTIANIVNKTIDSTLMSDPAVREYVTLVQQAVAAGIPISENAPGGVARFADGQAAEFRKKAGRAEETAKSPTFSKTGSAAAPAPAKAEGKLVKMNKIITEGGRKQSIDIAVPESEVSRAEAAGYKRWNKKD